MSMTPEAKGRLSKTIRALRTQLLADLKSSNESTYQFALNITKAKLTAAERARRVRIEEWVAEQVRTQAGRKKKRSAEDFRRDLEKQAAYTLLNRMVILRLMESMGLRHVKVATGGWESTAYKDFRELAPALIHGDASEGLAFLLRLVFEELATDMPGLYGPAGAAELIPIPPATLRAVIEAFDDPVLESCWTDDMTLGWVYQYWNDPEREALDAKINDGGKIEPHEIASKTQMFTERYMVDWLLQNSLGPMWLAMCRKHGWTPEAESSGTLEALEQRRVEWRAKRDAGEVELTELMPLHTAMERRWAYYVPQPIPEDAVEHAPESVRDLKILDPAVGSGHFLVVAFDLLFALYEEEARHRGLVVPPSGGQEPAEAGTTSDWTPKAIVERILEHNLHGIDLDPRAVQIAAAALWMKAQSKCPEAHPAQLNLVASNLGIANLPDNDPALVELRRAVEAETGIPAKLTNQIIEALRGADHLGSLLKVDKAIEQAITQHERESGWDGNAIQLKMFPDGRMEQSRLPFPRERLQVNLLTEIESFLARHSSGDDLGLRLRGAQLATGVRFVRLIRESTYDLVIGNPPYQGASKLIEAKWYRSTFPSARADLFAGFYLRGLQLVREGGISAFVALANWMFISTYADFRKELSEHKILTIAELGKAAFSTGGTLISTAFTVFQRARPTTDASIGIRPNRPSEVVRDFLQPLRTNAGLLTQCGRVAFRVRGFEVVRESPLIYWWTTEFLAAYAKATKIGDTSPVREGLSTSNNSRFVRKPWEVCRFLAIRTPANVPEDLQQGWVPTVMGAQAQRWFEPLNDLLRWHSRGLEMQVLHEDKYGSASRRIQSRDKYFAPGVAYAAIGSAFSGRVHRYASIFGSTGSSVFPDDTSSVVCTLNRTKSAEIATALNPTVHFTQGDVERLPVFPIKSCTEIMDRLEDAFSEHESHRECSVEFHIAGASPWLNAQAWAQRAVDRPENEPLPAYEPKYAPEPPTDHLSFAFGVALGRFGPHGEGALQPDSDDLAHALPSGILFLDGSLDDNDKGDGLDQPAAKIIREEWGRLGTKIASRWSLRKWLREKFFSDVHKGMYENRPIHWPLSSAKRTFVAWINIHRWDDSTLRVLLADHLQSALTRIEGQLSDLREARTGTDKKAVRDAEERYASVQKHHAELTEFIANVQQCAEKGPPPTDDKCPRREVDARYDPDLDDGVMINSAALWPLLEPQWKDPKKWWKQLALANSKGNKDYDWSHLAMRYFPKRVDIKCQTDPSLGVAHGCFWKYHPDRAWAWELRLQDEIAPEFRIQEEPYRGDGGDTEHRDAFLRDHPEKALEIVEKEIVRRRRNADDKIVRQLTLQETGLWSAIPELCWDLETRIIKKQEHAFRLIAPDEPEARAKLLAETPQKATGRERLLETRGGQAPYLTGWEEAVEQP